jgi:transposase-like protein
MSRRRHTAEQIITALREAELGLANGKTVGMVSRELGISEQTYYRSRKEFGGMKVNQARQSATPPACLSSPRTPHSRASVTGTTRAHLSL